MDSKEDGNKDELDEKDKLEANTSDTNTSGNNIATTTLQQDIVTCAQSSNNTADVSNVTSDLNQIIQDVDIENDIPVTQAMTASYSEISNHSDRSPVPSRPFDLPSNMSRASDKPSSLNEDGYVHYDGDMTHFVAEDLEFKIKLSSPITKRGETPVFGSRSSTPSSVNLFRQLMAPHIGQIDISILNDLEYEAQRIAQSVDSLIENLSGVLHSISSRTADNMEVYKDAVAKTCDAMDNNIRSMYTILAKGEEVSQAMRPVQAQAARITEIKRLLHLFESNL